MRQTSKKRIERVLRDARCKVFENESKYGPIIDRAKRLLMPDWERGYKLRQEKRLEQWFAIQ